MNAGRVPKPSVSYGIDERPDSLLETLLYGWQHTLVDISPFVLPLAVATALGMSPRGQGALISYGLVGMGLATLLQTTLGNRLPVIQGPSATLIGTLAPVAAQLGAGAMWGGIAVGAASEAVVGASGVLGRVKRLFPPAVSGVVVLSIGLSLGQLALRLAWGDGTPTTVMLAAAVLLTVVILQRQPVSDLLRRGAVFAAIWLVGIGLGAPLGRVDWGVVASRPWLAIPELFPYGSPWDGWQLSVAAIVAILAGVTASIVESIGDYVATCEVADAELEPRHVNRGIVAEGVGSLLAAAVGGLPCTSYSQNVGIIAATGVASRHVVRVAAVILLAYGLCPKFGALLVALPRSVLGGVFVLVCILIAGSGVRLLSRQSRGRAFALAAPTLMLALGVPALLPWLVSDPAALPPVVQMALGNTVVIAVLVAIPLNLVLRRGDGP